MSFLEVTAIQATWAKRKQHTHGGNQDDWLALIVAQDGRCAYSRAPLRFDVASSVRTARISGPHPLYASPTRAPAGDGPPVAIVSTLLLDIIVRLPDSVSADLLRLPSWKRLMVSWRALADASPNDRAGLRALIGR